MGSYGSGTGADYTTATRSVSDPARWGTADVWQLGDSIARADQGDLATRLAALNLTVAVDNWASRPTTPAVDELLMRLANHPTPRVVVMATGTNDIFDPPVVGPQVQRAAEACHDAGTNLLWVNTYAARWSLGYPGRESDQRNAGWVNLQIEQHAGDSGYGFGVVRWYEWLCGNPGYRLSNCLSDGVHTTELGRAARNSLITTAVQAALA